MAKNEGRALADVRDSRADILIAAIVNCVASGSGTSRAAISQELQLSRSTVSPRVDALIAAGLLVEHGPGPSQGGRPPVILGLNPLAGILLAVDLGASHVRAAVADLGGAILAQSAEAIDIAQGPEPVLNRVAKLLSDLVNECHRRPEDVVAIGIGLPGPVDHASGTAVRPPIMPGWDAFPIPAFFSHLYDAQVLVDNDVNVMALGEQATRRTDQHLLFVKIGTGIGCGIISGGVLHRGADGAAGDIGHIGVPGEEDVMCHCGNTGCLEAVASGAALVRQLSAEGLDVASPSDVALLAQGGDPAARRAVRIASRHIGEVLAGLVNFHNPEVIVLGGAMAILEEDLLTGVREVIYRRALPLATRSLRVETSQLGASTGLVGAVVLSRRAVLTPLGIGRWA